MITTKILHPLIALGLIFFITAIIYHGSITLIAYLFSNQSHSSIIYNEKNEIIGSSLIAQNFTKEKYFKPRPSFNNYQPLEPNFNNYFLTSKALKKSIYDKLELGYSADLLFYSKSGLDPHITYNAADRQINNVAKARGVTRDQISLILQNFIQTFPFSNYNYINVLLLNIELDKKFPVID